MDPLSRRRFLTISGATIAVAPAAACGRSPVTAGLTGTPERGVRKVATFCDEKMQAIKARYGPEAVALFSHGIGGTFLKHTLKAYGSPNIAARSFTQCHGPRDVGFQLTFGEDVGSPERTDIRNSRCLVLIGSHLGENMHNTQVQELADGVGSGATVIVVDPRFSIAAGKAKYYLPIKPGTDLALLLAWMNVLVAEQLWLSHREPMPTFQQFRGAGGQPPSREEIEKRMKEMRAAGPPPLADVQLFVSDHEKVGGVLLPRTVRRAVDGTTVEELQLTKLQVNPAFKADKFEKKECGSASCSRSPCWPACSLPGPRARSPLDGPPLFASRWPTSSAQSWSAPSSRCAQTASPRSRRRSRSRTSAASPRSKGLPPAPTWCERCSRASIPSSCGTCSSSRARPGARGSCSRLPALPRR